jgi:hypothetical protein
MQRRYRVLVHTAHGVQALIPDAIETCVGLPRLTPLEQTAPWVLGAFDLRGELVPVIGIGILRGEPPPIAAPTDLVLVISAAGFPVGIHTNRPPCVEPLQPHRLRETRSAWIDINRLNLTASAEPRGLDAETRLARFERRLSQQALQRLERRARCYGDFTGIAPPAAPAATPVRHWPA